MICIILYLSGSPLFECCCPTLRSSSSWYSRIPGPGKESNPTTSLPFSYLHKRRPPASSIATALVKQLSPSSTVCDYPVSRLVVAPPPNSPTLSRRPAQPQPQPQATSRYVRTLSTSPFFLQFPHNSIYSTSLHLQTAPSWFATRRPSLRSSHAPISEDFPASPIRLRIRASLTTRAPGALPKSYNSLGLCAEGVP